MKRFKYILLLFCFSAIPMLSQTSFKSIDSLIIKNVEALNLNDSAYYISLLNKPIIFKDKKLKSKRDSLEILKPFTEAFADMIDELKELAASENIEITYGSYESRNSSKYDSTVTGKVLVHIKLIINNNFTVKIPFMISAYNGLYAIETPMMVMFADE